MIVHLGMTLAPPLAIDRKPLLAVCPPPFPPSGALLISGVLVLLAACRSVARAASTGATHPLDVIWCEGVSTPTVSRSRLQGCGFSLMHSQVPKAWNGYQMVRSHTTAILAKMVDMVMMWYRAVRQQIRKTVGVYDLAVQVESAISVVCGSLPKQAIAHLLNLRPEAMTWGASHGVVI